MGHYLILAELPHCHIAMAKKHDTISLPKVILTGADNYKNWLRAVTNWLILKRVYYVAHSVQPLPNAFSGWRRICRRGRSLTVSLTVLSTLSFLGPSQGLNNRDQVGTGRRVTGLHIAVSQVYKGYKPLGITWEGRKRMEGILGWGRVGGAVN